jgi:hypothetical protein
MPWRCRQPTPTLVGQAKSVPSLFETDLEVWPNARACQATDSPLSRVRCSEAASEVRAPMNSLKVPDLQVLSLAELFDDNGSCQFRDR